jgi:hypothetical protein
MSTIELPMKPDVLARALAAVERDWQIAHVPQLPPTPVWEDLTVSEIRRFYEKAMLLIGRLAGRVTTEAAVDMPLQYATVIHRRPVCEGCGAKFETYFDLTAHEGDCYKSAYDTRVEQLRP